MTIISGLVDDGHQEYGQKYRHKRSGRKVVFTDGEVITLILVQEFIPYPSETQYLEFIRAIYLALFPKLPDQSQFNRHARSLHCLVEELRRYGIAKITSHILKHVLLANFNVKIQSFQAFA